MPVHTLGEKRPFVWTSGFYSHSRVLWTLKKARNKVLPIRLYGCKEFPSATCKYDKIMKTLSQCATWCVHTVRSVYHLVAAEMTTSTPGKALEKIKRLQFLRMSICLTPKWFLCPLRTWVYKFCQGPQKNKWF